MKRNFAIIGYGGISKFYVKGLVKNGNQLVAVCDIDKNKLAKVSKRIERYTEIDQLLLSNAFDSVIVTTPNYTHTEIVTKILNAGKNVLCEKPLTLNLKETKRIVALALKHNLLLMTAFHRRYNNQFTDLVNYERKNEIVSIYVRYWEDIKIHSSGEKWYLEVQKSGGGCVIDNGINVFDCLISMLADIKLDKVKLLPKSKTRPEMQALINFHHKRIKIIVDLDWEYNGENKEMTIFYKDGRQENRNFLKQSKSFKGSLWHEYEGLIKDFCHKLQVKNFIDENSIKVMSLVEQVYKKTGKSRVASFQISSLRNSSS